MKPTTFDTRIRSNIKLFLFSVSSWLGPWMKLVTDGDWNFVCIGDFENNLVDREVDHVFLLCIDISETIDPLVRFQTDRVSAFTRLVVKVETDTPASTRRLASTGA